MQRVTLENTDLRVSQLCYGTNMMGTAMDQAASSEMLDTFVALGGNFIDTARSYGDWVPTAPAGASERAIGAWLRNRQREDVVIATKGGQFDMRASERRSRCNPADITQDLAESLEHLGVEQIDLYWVHRDDTAVPVGEIMDMLIGQQAAGRIRWFGASNWTAERVTAAQSYAASVGHAGFAALQPFWGLARPDDAAATAQGYNLHYEGRFEELHKGGLPMIPYAGQSRGFFSKLAGGGEGALPAGLAAMYLSDVNRRRMLAVKQVAGRHAASINDVVLGYLVCQPRQTIPIVGARTPEQLRETVGATRLQLSADDLAELAG